MDKGQKSSVKVRYAVQRKRDKALLLIDGDDGEPGVVVFKEFGQAEDMRMHNGNLPTR